MPGWEQHLLAEHDETRERMERLREFLNVSNVEAIARIPERQRDLLFQQFDALCTYYMILVQRIFLLSRSEQDDRRADATSTA